MWHNSEKRINHVCWVAKGGASFEKCYRDASPFHNFSNPLARGTPSLDFCDARESQLQDINGPRQMQEMSQDEHTDKMTFV
jgi:hypothetical protein